ncbi:hypothetical protein [Jannaschia pohangensis]|uniref:PH domain-containing protein n=1 Tax=Jannaschia pohangensis TaxID=390807 RepID=A0A1I3LZQ3_9RHOB|nr:hypothetical protein [Jannaschia pohangensis]SFI90249.1 hypothetical protein SAMN04488095_1687 [Jannaschia pohangensis]
MNDIIHVLRPSQPRRVVGLVIQVSLGLLLLWLAFLYPPETFGWQIFLIGMGVAALVLATRGWQGSSVAIVLDDGGLRQEDGVQIAPIDNIASVDRALFSFKPSNGFLIRLHEAPGRAWVPGMWWRIGRRVGIGGVTGGAETKMMADALSFMVAQRDRPEDYQ